MTSLPLPAPPLSDGVIALRPHRDDDVAVFATMSEDPDIRRWITLPAGYGEQQARDFARENEAARLAGRKVFLVITDAASEEVVGDCEVHLPGDDRRAGELGYLLLPAARGRGYATRAVRLLAAFATGQLGMTRVQALAHPDNGASCRVLERAGFIAEALLPDARGPGEDRVLYVLPGSTPGP